MSVLGIDLSLTSTGLARIDDAGTITTHTVTSSGKATATLVERHARMAHIFANIWDWRGTFADYVVIEAPSYGSVGGAGHDRSGLWWLVVREYLAAFTPVVTIAPATRAKWATGTGRADKAAVAAALTRLMPDVEIRNADEADALVLAHMGAVALGYPVPRLDGRHSELPKAIAGWAA